MPASRCIGWLAVVVLGAQSAAGAEAPAPRTRIFDFAVDVDGRPVGAHRFEVRSNAEDGRTEVLSRAQFTYRLLGVTLYRYKHEADELWRDGCVTQLRASTDDNGKRLNVSAALQGTRLHIEGAGAPQVETDCVHTFAYWDSRLLTEASLLNPQTGQMDVAHLEELGTVALELADGRSVQARKLGLTANRLRIDLWYASDGEWLQLESTTAEGKHLRYRLQRAQ